MAELIRPGKKRTLTLTALRGTAPPVPARLDGEPVWTVDTEGIVSLFPHPGGMAVDVGFISAGTVKITAKADADLTAGVREITEMVEITCREEEAERLAITVGPEIDL